MIWDWEKTFKLIGMKYQYLCTGAFVDEHRTYGNLCLPGRILCVCTLGPPLLSIYLYIYTAYTQAYTIYLHTSRKTPTYTPPGRPPLKHLLEDPTYTPERPSRPHLEDLHLHTSWKTHTYYTCKTTTCTSGRPRTYTHPGRAPFTHQAVGQKSYLAGSLRVASGNLFLLI